jgi:hypothetical protein
MSLSNVALVGCLGVRSLTKEDKLYIRLRRLGKYFSTGEEIYTFCESDLNRVLSCCCSSHCIHRARCIHSYASMRFICASMQ